MSVFDKLQPASYKGIPFLARTEETEEGPKIAVHEYVNSKRRFVENLGELPPIFNVEIIIHGDDMIGRRDALRSKLNDGQAGVLVLPVVGSVTVKNGSFTSRTSDQRVGEVIFRVTFYAEDGAAFPTQVEPTTSSTGRIGDSARDVLKATISKKVSVPETGPSQEVLTEKISETGSAMEAAFSSISGLEQDITDITASVNSMINDAAELARFPELLSDRIDTAFRTLRGVGANIESLISLAAFGLDDPEIDAITPDRAARAASNKNINEAVRVQAIVAAYEQAAGQDFSNDTQLSSIVDSLESAFEDVLTNSADILNTDLGDDQTIRVSQFDTSIENASDDVSLFDAVNDVRTSALAVLSESEGANFKVAVRDVPLTGVALLSYQLYGHLDNTASLGILNFPDHNLSHISGDASVFEVVDS
jgi:hypothetical protein